MSEKCLIRSFGSRISSQNSLCIRHKSDNRQCSPAQTYYDPNAVANPERKWRYNLLPLSI